MPTRKEPELAPAEQYKRFKEAADREDEFERDFRKVAPHRPKRTASKKR